MSRMCYNGQKKQTTFKPLKIQQVADKSFGSWMEWSVRSTDRCPHLLQFTQHYENTILQQHFRNDILRPLLKLCVVQISLQNPCVRTPKAIQCFVSDYKHAIGTLMPSAHISFSGIFNINMSSLLLFAASLWITAVLNLSDFSSMVQQFESTSSTPALLPFHLLLHCKIQLDIIT